EHVVVAGIAGGTQILGSIQLELPGRLEHLAPLAVTQVQRLLDFRAKQLRDDRASPARLAQPLPLSIVGNGSSGQIGSQLDALLETGGNTVCRVIGGHRVGPRDIAWSLKAGQQDPADLEGMDVVVNPAGPSVATRWTPAARREILDSRINGTALISR